MTTSFGLSWHKSGRISRSLHVASPGFTVRLAVAVSLGLLALPLAAQQALTDPGQKSGRIGRFVLGALSITPWRGSTSFIATRDCQAAERSRPTSGISKAIPKASIPIRRPPVSVCACRRTRGSGAGSNTRRTRPISIRRSASSIAATFPMPRPISVICCALLQDTCNRC